MKYLVATLLGVLGLYALLVVAGNGGRPRTAAFPDRGDSSNDAGVSEEERRRGDRLDARLAEVIHRMTVKEQVASALMAGRITLFEAAARFRAVQHAATNATAAVLGTDPQCSPQSAGERCCRLVITYIRHHWEDIETTPGIVARLEKTLEEELRRDGEICLPSVNEK